MPADRLRGSGRPCERLSLVIHGQELLCFLRAEFVASTIFRSLAGFTTQAIQPYSRETQAPASGWDSATKTITAPSPARSLLDYSIYVESEVERVTM